MTVEQALLLGVEGVAPPGLARDAGQPAGRPDSESRPHRLVPPRHRHVPRTRRIAVVAVRPDGEVLIAGDGATAAVHDADTLDVVHTFDTPLKSRAYRPDGEQLAVSTQTFASSGTVRRRLRHDPGASLERRHPRTGAGPARRVARRRCRGLGPGLQRRRTPSRRRTLRHARLVSLGLQLHRDGVGPGARPSTPCRASRSVVRGGWPSASTAAGSTSGATRTCARGLRRGDRCAARLDRAHPRPRAGQPPRRPTSTRSRSAPTGQPSPYETATTSCSSTPTRSPSRGD